MRPREKSITVLLAFDGLHRVAPGMDDDGFESYDPLTARKPTEAELLEALEKLGSSQPLNRP